MKQLQNNFTTPEQSKRLLELGVPADSADMHMSYSSHDSYSAPQWNDVRVTAYQSYFPTLDIIPCWSVGRLMEIYDTCDAEYMHKGWDTYFDLTIDYIEFVVRMLEFDIPRGKIDLSRLED